MNNRKPLKEIYLIFAFFIFPSLLKAANIEILNAVYTPFLDKPDISTGIDDIFVLWDTKGISIKFVAEDAKNVEWLKYSSLGGGYAEEISGIRKEGHAYILDDPEGNLGYIINEDGRQYVFWIVDYSTNPLILNNLELGEESSCEMTVLDFIGSATPIYYYSINGRREILNRGITLSYNNLVHEDGENNFKQSEITEALDYIEDKIYIFPPLYCSSNFFIEGDRFLKFWGKEMKIQSAVYQPIAVSVYTSVEASEETKENSGLISSGEDGMLGGSAPFSASFYSYSTDAVIHYEWQMADDPEFKNVSYRIYDSDFDYTFLDEGVTYIRFIGSNADGSCEAIGETYNVSIGASKLLIPNVFSPNGDGINDIWKVSYRSIIEFKCWIFDRHGHQIYYFDSPDGSWNGKNGSKFVNPGVYYYVIEALGADGVKYKRSGDINILNSTSVSGSNNDFN